MGWKKVLRASWMLHPAKGQPRKQRNAFDVPLGIDLQKWGRCITLFSTLHGSSRVLWCSLLAGRMEWVKQMEGTKV